MYSIEGSLVVRNNPEQLLGKFGCYFLDDQPDGIRYTRRLTLMRIGDEAFVVQSRDKLIEEGLIATDTPVEHITSIEEAEKYTPPYTKPLQIVERQLPNLNQALASYVTEDLELLEGSAMLWKDRRYPTSQLYFRAKGTLLAKVEYDKEDGWYDVHDEVSGTRTIKGIGFLSMERTTTISETKGINRNGARVKESITTSTDRNSDFQLNFNFNIGKKKPSTENTSSY
jgi:hypothetical protein